MCVFVGAQQYDDIPPPLFVVCLVHRNLCFRIPPTAAVIFQTSVLYFHSSSSCSPACPCILSLLCDSILCAPDCPSLPLPLLLTCVYIYIQRSYVLVAAGPRRAVQRGGYTQEFTVNYSRCCGDIFSIQLRSTAKTKRITSRPNPPPPPPTHKNKKKKVKEEEEETYPLHHSPLSVLVVPLTPQLLKTCHSIRYIIRHQLYSFSRSKRVFFSI